MENPFKFGTIVDSYSLGNWRGLPLSNIHNNDGRIHLYS